MDFPVKKVTLVHRGQRLLEFVTPAASKKALNWLTSKKVEVILGQSVDLEGASYGRYLSSGGETIIADCHFLCTGKPLASSWLNETFINKSLDDKGRIIVDKHLRVAGHTNIFALGDITNIPVSSHFQILIPFISNYDFITFDPLNCITISGN